MKIVRAFATAVVAGVLLGACALFTGGVGSEESPPPVVARRSKPKVGLSAAEVEKHGARILKRPYAQVFEACKDALLASGYRIAVSKPKRGLLISGRMRVGRETATLGIWLPGGVAGSTTQSVSYSRQYTVRFKSLGPRRTWVAAVPAVFAGAHDISGRVRWNLRGGFGERARWKQLFRKVRELLPDGPKPKPPTQPRERPIPPPAQ